MSYCRFYARWLRFWYIKAPVPFEVRKLVGLVFPAPRNCRIQIAGYDILLDLRDLVQANLLLEGQWEPDISRWWAYLAQSAQAILDVGAHCGYYSLIARRYAPANAMIYALEPNPVMCKQYERNMELNHLNGFQLAQIAASQSSGTQTLHIRSTLEPGASSVFDIPYADESLTVPTVSLDDYCDAQHIERVDLLKMDIEGAEESAIQGMSRGLKQGRYRVLLMELHPRNLVSGVAALLDQLCLANYLIYEPGPRLAIPVADHELHGTYILALAPQIAADVLPRQPDGHVEIPSDFKLKLFDGGQT